MSQLAIDQVIKNLKTLLAMDKVKEVFEIMSKEIAPISDDLNNSIIMNKGNYSGLERQKLLGIISNNSYGLQSRQIKFNLIGIIDIVKSELEAKRIMGQHLSIYTITSNDNLEKIQGPDNNLVPISWIHKCIEASKSVCQVKRDDGKHGTGWLLEDGWMMTNAHVIPNKDWINRCEIVFNYEEGLNGSNPKTSTYKLDTEGALFSSLSKLDYAYIKVVDEGEVPLSNWRHLEVDTFSAPQKGQPVAIIQHPKGEKKQIALTHNQIINVDGHKIFYLTDTERGSSGSPALNLDWKVIALHHAGKTEDQDGGMVIDSSTGEKQGANEGILIKDIMADINSKKGT